MHRYPEQYSTEMQLALVGSLDVVNSMSVSARPLSNPEVLTNYLFRLPRHSVQDHCFSNPPCMQLSAVVILTISYAQRLARLSLRSSLAPPHPPFIFRSYLMIPTFRRALQQTRLTHSANLVLETVSLFSPSHNHLHSIIRPLSLTYILAAASQSRVN